MDYVLSICDNLFFDRLYATALPASNPWIPFPSLESLKNNATLAFLRENTAIEVDPISQYFNLEPSKYATMSQLARGDWERQAISLFFITWLFGLLIYFTFASLSYVFIFDKDTFKHPKFLKNQMRQEIQQTMVSLPVMAVFTVPFFLAEVRGYSLLYNNIEDHGMWYFIAQFPLFLMFTDCAIYFIHRGLHHPLVYKQLHKPHHKWIMPTPYASHAFHPLDGYAQGVPYHVFPFLFPLHKFAYLALFAFINIWTVMIHDGEYVANSPVINGAACHTMHHLYFNYNYGQFTTLWDRLGGSYRKPNMELFYRETKMGKQEWERQVKEMEKVVKEVEGNDSFREYLAVDVKKQQ
ncbi:c-5 sterol desaturase [Rhizina undulata]